MVHCTRTLAAGARCLQIQQLLRWGSAHLYRSGIESSWSEACWLWEAAGGGPAWRMDRRGVPPTHITIRFRRLVDARCRRVPLAYLTRRVGFMDLELAVRPGVFVPRPETEELAEMALTLLSTLPKTPRILDLGTGSGAIACAVANTRRDARVLAVDAAPRALACARTNVRRLGLSAQIEVRRSDWFSEVDGRFNLITANPPYISTNELSTLEPEVRQYEPRSALAAGEDGLAEFRRILAGLPFHLVHGGHALLEIGHMQARGALALANGMPGLVESKVHNDIGGRARILAIRWM